MMSRKKISLPLGGLLLSLLDRGGTINQGTENPLVPDLHDQPLGHNDAQTGQDKAGVFIELDKNNSESGKPSGRALRAVRFQGPGKGDRRTRQQQIAQNVREDDEKAGAQPEVRDSRPDPPGISCRNSGKEGEQEAMRRSAMKGTAVPVQEETREHIHIRQVGQDREVKGRPPTRKRVPLQ